MLFIKQNFVVIYSQGIIVIDRIAILCKYIIVFSILLDINQTLYKCKCDIERGTSIIFLLKNIHTSHPSMPCINRGIITGTTSMQKP